MKAVVFKGAGSEDLFKLESDLPVPAIGENDVLVRIVAAAFNPIDYQMTQPRPESKRMHSPILGREFAGVVAETGARVSQFSVGDPVFAASGSMGSNGTYAEYIRVPDQILVLKPESLTFEEAAALPVASLTALQTYRRLAIQPDDSVFVSGAAGGVGLVFVKLLLAKGHRQIIVTAGNEVSKNELLNTGLSSAQIIDYRSEQVIEQILAANNQLPFDHCIDMVGGSMSEVCGKVIATNGQYADITALTTEAARHELFNKGAVIFNISNYAYSLNGNLNYYGETLRELSTLIESKLLSASPVQLVGNLSAETVVRAHHILEKNLTKGRKLVMVVG